MLRYFGVLSAHSALRPPPAEGDQLELDFMAPKSTRLADDRPAPRKRWAWLLRHVFAADLERCTRCGGPMRWVEAATTPTPSPACSPGRGSHRDHRRRLPRLLSGRCGCRSARREPATIADHGAPSMGTLGARVCPPSGFGGAQGTRWARLAQLETPRLTEISPERPPSPPPSPHARPVRAPQSSGAIRKNRSSCVLCAPMRFMCPMRRFALELAGGFAAEEAQRILCRGGIAMSRVYHARTLAPGGPPRLAHPDTHNTLPAYSCGTALMARPMLSALA
jgi:NAD-dependent dihydropyrimidine dehydrogenase PreA subunit